MKPQFCSADGRALSPPLHPCTSMIRTALTEMQMTFGASVARGVLTRTGRTISVESRHTTGTTRTALCRSTAAPCAGHSTWFALLDASGKPNTNISKRPVLWIVYAMAYGMSVTRTAWLSRHVLSLTQATVIDWRNISD